MMLTVNLGNKTDHAEWGKRSAQSTVVPWEDLQKKASKRKMWIHNVGRRKKFIKIYLVCYKTSLSQVRR